jgi:hypothetical protein
MDRWDAERSKRHPIKRPGTIVAVILIAAAIGFLGYTMVGTEKMERTAESVGSSTTGKDANQPSDRANRSQSDTEMRDSNVPPATAR